MTERSPEDELIAEARKFGYAMKEMLRLHAQAGNWLERRRIRKQISLALREQRRSEQADRENQLVWTQQMIDRYRAHSLAVAERAADPIVDHQRRWRDSAALARHSSDLRSRIVANGRLTPVEQGIALDGLDAATTFPRFEPGRLFDQAHKVRGIDAVRYRAHVARAVREQGQSDRSRDHRGRQAHPAARVDFGHASVVSPTSHLTWDQQAAVHELRLVELQWEAQAPTAGDADLRSLDRRRQAAAERAAKVGLTSEQIRHELDNVDANSRYAATIAYREPGEMFQGVAETFKMRSFHASEAEAAEWADRRLRDTDWTPGTAMKVTVRDRDNSRLVRVTDGGLEHVSKNMAQRRGGVERGHTPDRERETVATNERPPEPGRPDQAESGRLVEIERRLRDMSADRDRLESRVGVLQRGLDAVTADRDEMKRKLDAAEGHIQELKNRNIRLANEIGQLRDRPSVEQVAAERDRYKRERDEAVQTLAQTTPEHERFGNRNSERGTSAADGWADRDQNPGRSGDTQPWRAADLKPPSGADRNGNRRNGTERSR